MALLRAAAAHSLTLALLAIAAPLSSLAQGAPLDPNAFASLGTLDVSAGTLTINTDTLAITGAAAFTGVTVPQSGGPEIAVFTFDNIDVDAAVTVTFSGSRPVALLSQGNAVIGATLNVNGGVGGSNGNSTPGAAGPAGGASGGGSTPAMGPGAAFIGGGGFGGVGGGRGAFSPTFGGPAYGDLANILQGGSGGGGVGPGQGNQVGGGGGAGAIEIGAVNLLSLGTINAFGGAGGISTFGAMYSGSGGSGGAVLLHGEVVSFGALSLRGGNGGFNATFGGGGGGGGRLRLVTGQTYVLGQAPPSGLNANGGTGGPTVSGGGVSGMPGSAGVTELVPGLTVIPAGQARQLDGSGRFSEPLSSGWTLRATNLQLNSGALAFATVPVDTTFDIMLNGGALNAALGWTMTGTSAVTGFGQVSGAVVGSATNHVAASGGALTLGDANSNSGFNFAGTVDIASGATLDLLDADAAELGAATTLAGGGRLNSLNGIQLGAGEIVTASAAAEIGGKFTNQGTVNGPTTAGEFLTFTDDVNGAGNYTGNVLFSDGFSPGASPAQVSFEHVAFDATAELSIELGGTSAGSQFDQLIVSGDATLAGRLTVSLIDGFSPSAGQTFTILTAGAVDGVFTSEVIPAVPGFNFDVIYNPNSVVLTVSPAFTADFDEDGDVDSDDLNQWQGDFGANALSDADDDGDSDGADFLAWQRQLGSPLPAIPAAGAVPEPGTAALMAAALLAVFAWYTGRTPRSTPG